MTQIISVTNKNLVTPKAGTKWELLLNEPASTFYACVWPEPGLLKKGSCLARVLGVTKFTNDRDMIWSHFVVPLESDLDIQQTHLWAQFVERA